MAREPRAVTVDVLGRLWIFPPCPVPVSRIARIALPPVPHFIALSVNGGPRQMVPVTGEAWDD